MVRRAVAVGALSLMAVVPATAAPLSVDAPLPDDAFTRVDVPQAVDAPRPAPAAAPRRPRPPRAVSARPEARRRPDVAIPAARVIVVVVEAPRAPTRSLGRRLVGRASWYCRAGVSSCMARHPDGPGLDLYAAAGPRLRVAMGGGVPTTAPDPWRGRVVTVSANGRSVRVRLADWCQCFHGRTYEKVVDLYYDVWRYLGITGGSNLVTIAW